MLSLAARKLLWRGVNGNWCNKIEACIWRSGTLWNATNTAAQLIAGQALPERLYAVLYRMEWNRSDDKEIGEYPSLVLDSHHHPAQQRDESNGRQDLRVGNWM